MTIPEPPGPSDDARPLRRIERPVAFIATMGGGLCLFAIVIGISFIGVFAAERAETRVQAITALASIGSSLAGGFAGWLGQGMARANSGGSRDDRRGE